MIQAGTATAAKGTWLEFCDLLTAHMRRIRASANGVANEIGMSREAVNNWRHGYSMPSRKHRDRVLDCARYLRLTEDETNAFLVAARFEPEYAGTSELGKSPFVDHLFDQLARLAPYSIKLLLSQAGWGQPPCRDSLLAMAGRLYGEDQVIHIQPPFSVHAARDEYFRLIGEQCGLNVDSDFAFEAGLEGRLQNAERLFCLVSRFEQGDAELREQLAGILRSLSEMYAGKLHLLLCGGPALADLKFRSGDLSLLNIAEVSYWPEPGTAEVNLLAREMGQETVSEDVAASLIPLCGGHPGLIQEALALQARDIPVPDIEHRLADSERLWQAFAPLASDPTLRQSLFDALSSDRLGPARPYLVEPLRRTLFWQNLIAARDFDDGRFLVWRCEAIRRAGLAVCEQWSDDL